MISGRHWLSLGTGLQLRGLSFFAKFSVQYDANAAAETCVVDSEAFLSIQITSGCGVAFRVESGQPAQASCFVCVKNRKSKWWSFCKENAEKCQRQAQSMKSIRSLWICPVANRQWRCNLDGSWSWLAEGERKPLLTMHDSEFVADPHEIPIIVYL